jgi:hypothetical protein
MNTPSLFNLLTANFMYLGEAAVCIVCLIMVLRSEALPAAAARLGATGFACLLFQTILGIGGMVMVMTKRDAFQSATSLASAMGAIGMLRVALQIAGLLCIALAILSGRERAQPLSP